ncbi:MAG: hypothetical protein ACE5H0_06025, partial [Bacteroidota bacterium]
ASARTSVGFEKYPTGQRKFVQQSQLSLGGTSTTLQRVQIALQEDVSYTSSYSFGNIFQNTARLNVTTNAISRFVVGVELSRNDTRYFNYAAVPPRSITSLGGNVAARLRSTTLVELRHSRSWTRSWYAEQTTSSRASISESGLSRNLTFQIRGEQTFNDVTRIEALSVEGIVDYRFHALTLIARYSLRSVGNIRTQGMMLEVQRPFAFNFR